MNDLLQNDNRIIKLFTIKKGISPSLLSRLTLVGYPHYVWVDTPEQADYLTFPTNYEVGHELTDYYIHYFNGVPEDRFLALQYEEKLITFSQKLNKKIIIFYFSDLADPIPISNAIIFRTSLLKSSRRPNEFAMPAFKADFAITNVYGPEYIEWSEKPRVGFKGQTAPLQLRTKLNLRNRINLFYNSIGRKAVFKLKANYGYMQRRNALLYLQKSDSIICDFSITTEQDISNEDSIRLYWTNIRSNAYNLCVSGYGNYSYRLYEVLSAGRIPIFVDTDCVLPFEEFINWKELVVWVNENDIPKINQILLAFHYTKQGTDFIHHQERLKHFWTNFLSPDTFFIKLKIYL